MTSKATMTKQITGAGVLNDKTPDLFKRHEKRSIFGGFASFECTDTPCVILEVADTPEKKAKGLMGRTLLPECCGMIFTELSGGAFWMKGCKIPLDIVFIDMNGRVSTQYSMELDNGSTRYIYGNEKVAIELPYGFCARHGVAVGTICNWRIW